MLKSKIVKLLQPLSKKEIKKLGRFLASPYFNTNTTTQEIFRALAEFHPQFRSTGLQKAAVFERVFPEDAPFTKAKDRKFRDALSDLTKKVEVFYAVERFQYRPDVYFRELSEALRDREHNELFFTRVQRAEREMKKKKTKDLEYFLQRLWLSYIQYVHPAYDPLREGPGRQVEMMNLLDECYFLHKLRYACELLNRQNFLSEQHDIALLDEVINQSQRIQNPLPLTIIYRNLILLGRDENFHTLYPETKKLVFETSASIDRWEQASILKLLTNIVIRKSNAGQPELRQELLSLYRFGLDCGLYVLNGCISAYTFLNILITAAVLKEFHLAEQLLEDYGHRIEEQKQKTTIHLSRAYLAFHRGHYQKAVQEALLADRRFSPFRLRIRSLLLRTLYEFQNKGDDTYYDRLVTEANNFRQYLRKKADWAENKKQPYYNFIKFTLQLARHLLLDDKLDKAVLKKQVADQPIIAHEWLLAKINELD